MVHDLERQAVTGAAQPSRWLHIRREDACHSFNRLAREITVAVRLAAIQQHLIKPLQIWRGGIETELWRRIPGSLAVFRRITRENVIARTHQFAVVMFI